MTDKRGTETVTAPRRTLDMVREHLAKNGAIIGRAETVSQFVAEACRKLVQLDLEWMKENDLAFHVPGQEPQEPPTATRSRTRLPGKKKDS